MKKAYPNNYPFVGIFKMMEEKVPVYKIAKAVNLSSVIVTQIVNGQLTIPEEFISEIESAGFKICSCCHKRIVPLRTFDNVHLTTLCPTCYRLGGGDEEYKVHLPINNYP